MMSFSSYMLIFAMCAFFFVSLFTLEGFSDDGMEGIKERYRSISGSLICFFITFILFYITRNF